MSGVATSVRGLAMAVSAYSATWPAHRTAAPEPAVIEGAPAT